MKSIRSRNVSIVIVLGVITLFTCMGCGPTNEEIMAREQAKLEQQRQAEEARRIAEEQRRQAEEAKRRAEEAKRQAEAARLAKIRVTESAGDGAAKAGDVNTALARYQEVMNLSGDNLDEDQRLREKIIRLVVSSKIKPPIPEEARRYAVRSQALVKTKRSAGYAQAVAELTNAIRLAPWWADGYYNLGLMQQGAEDFAGAIRSLKLCLLADANAANAAAIRNKIYELEVLQEESGRIQAMAGKWKNPKSGIVYDVTIDGKNFKAVSNTGSIIRGVMEGNTITGTITVPAWKSWTNCYCMTPEYTVPLSSGKISPDRRSMTFTYIANSYNSSYWSEGGGHFQGECRSVTLAGTAPDEITMTR